MPLIIEYAKRFGVYDDLLPVLSMSLGAGETTLLRMAPAYCMIANGGKQVQPTLIDRIQDRWGRTVWRHDKRDCKAARPKLAGPGRAGDRDDRRQIMDPHDRLPDHLHHGGRGPARHGAPSSEDAPNGRWPARPAPPTRRRTPGSSATRPISWSACSSATTRRTMGKGKTGGHSPRPIFGNFMKVALADKPPAPFRIPPGIKLVRVRPAHGSARAARRRDGVSSRPSSRARSRTTPTRSSASPDRNGRVLDDGVSPSARAARPRRRTAADCVDARVSPLAAARAALLSGSSADPPRPFDSPRLGGCHARRNREARRFHQPVPGAAAEASLTGIRAEQR